MAANDLESTMHRIEDLESDLIFPALQGINRTAMGEGERGRLLTAMDGLPYGYRETAQSQIACDWMQIDFEDAVKWMRSRPEADQKPLLTLAGTWIAQADPQRGAALMLEKATNAERPDIYKDITQRLFYADSASAGQWLSKQPQSPDLDLARGRYASLLAYQNSEAAMQWAMSVQDEKQRTDAVQDVYRTARVNDAKAADRVLDASGLPADQIQAIRKAPKLNEAPPPF
jgi:hypothetical protein